MIFSKTLIHGYFIEDYVCYELNIKRLYELVALCVRKNSQTWCNCHVIDFLLLILMHHWQR